MRFTVPFVLVFGVTSAVTLSAACGGGSEAAPFGCCSSDPQRLCGTANYGRPKKSEADTCIDGADGLIPDPSQPGWTTETRDGCPRAVPPANAKRVQCGAAVDAGTPPFGCCPADPKLLCGTANYGRPKKSAADNCVDGADGIVPVADQPGWTTETRNGCPRAVPPPNAKTFTCGSADAGGDAGPG